MLGFVVPSHEPGGRMLDQTFAHEFAAEWIAAWNAWSPKRSRSMPSARWSKGRRPMAGGSRLRSENEGGADARIGPSTEPAGRQEAQYIYWPVAGLRGFVPA